MAKPRVFISSTCFDLGLLRSELRPFISMYGYEPIMSEYSDILYDPRSHTHVSCVNEVVNCDVLVLILGQRFGGTAVDAALECLDFDVLAKTSSTSTLFELADSKFSITQLEVLKAIESGIPIYAFVDEKVYHDHLVYEKNKSNKEVIDRIKFPSIQRNETAKYIFEFINYLSHRVQNNSITPFARLEDIRNNLTAQWAHLFQRLLFESKERSNEVKRYQDFSERLEDLKTAVLASIATPDTREIAKAAVQFRHVVTFIWALPMEDHIKILNEANTWSEVLECAGITDVKVVGSGKGLWKRRAVCLLRVDRAYYEYQYSIRGYERLEDEWNEFVNLKEDVRKAISEAFVDDNDRSRLLKLHEGPFEDIVESEDIQDFSSAVKEAIW
ncbi:DUF4062 domain-containing protein [Pseudomonas putida]|uniref:DUF4062 domain-containing protein n=1 Tax=Pseudomonas putida TaxID=303 RepID=UPI0009A1E799|nr:DUF4062 domain-containing protein [Pseudomonas putida]